MWQKNKHPDIEMVKKAVGEYKVEILGQKFKIKIYVKAIGLYIGYANLQSWMN